MSRLSLSFTDVPGNAPASIQLPPGQDIELESVTCEWNGAAASGTFMPCLSIYSQDGVLLSRTFPGRTLAVGDSAEVTYAPFLGGGDSTGATPIGCQYFQSNAKAQSVPDSFLFETALQFDRLDWDSDSMLNSAVSETTFNINTAGVYVYRANVSYTVSAAGDYGISVAPTVGGVGQQWEAEQIVGTTGNDHANVTAMGISTFVAGTTCQVLVTQKTGAARTVAWDGVYCSFIKVADYPA